MSLLVTARSFMLKVSHFPRWLLRFHRRRVTPLTFAELDRRRREVQGQELDRTPCQCSECRQSRK